MPADDPKSPENKKSVDLTDPARTEELSDEELKKVTGGFQRATLSTSSLPKTAISGSNFETVYGGVGNDTLLGLNVETAFGGFNINPVDKLKR